jgi:magnesium-transporting ATPase (P-type)
MASMGIRLYCFLIEKGPHLKYLYRTIKAKDSALKVVGSFYSLMNQLIPLALIVSVEIAKVWYAKIIEWDKELRAYDSH